MYLDRTRGILDGFWCEGKCEGRKFALTLALTTETPINMALQAESEGVRVKKEKNFFSFFTLILHSSFFILHSSFFILLAVLIIF